MLHLCKLSVGIADIAQLRAAQARRLANDPPLRHQTRNTPRRAAEVLDGGSIYWVVAGVMQVRQRIVDIQPAIWDDGSACAALVLDPTLVLVSARKVRAFQGWRYLEAEDAPPDLTNTVEADAGFDMPETMRQDLRALCLI